MSTLLERTDAFCSRFGLSAPILLAPMAGVPSPTLSIAVARAGGLGGCGALMMQPGEIIAWAEQVRTAGSGTGSDVASGAFQFNLWIPDPTPRRDRAHETQVREFLSRWGPAVPAEAGDVPLPEFAAQCDAVLSARPRIASSIMGLYPPAVVTQLKQRGIAWFATVSTVAEARAAAAAGADAIIAQGMEAGGHRGCFEASRAEQQQVGLFALLPAIAAVVNIPIVAAGGIANTRGLTAALMLGASAVQIGTGFLRCPEAGIHPAWADALANTAPEDTMLTRAFSGRAGRSIATDYVRAALAAGESAVASYPVQRGLSAGMRATAQKTGDLQRMQVWAGQSAWMAQAAPAGEVVRELWDSAKQLLT